MFLKLELFTFAIEIAPFCNQHMVYNPRFSGGKRRFFDSPSMQQSLPQRPCHIRPNSHIALALAYRSLQRISELQQSAITTI